MPRFAFALALLVAGCAARAPTPVHPAAPEPVSLGDDLSVAPIAPSVLMHTSWKTLPELGRVGSNGLVVLGEREALLVDTTWDDDTTRFLLDYVERAHDRRVTHLVVTHSHDDRLGGIREALRRGVVVHALDRTAERAALAGFPRPTETFTHELSLEVDGVRAEVLFPGPAHAPDNLVVFLPASGVLFGSCMIREAIAPSVGNRADASLSTWIAALDAVRARFPSPAIVVPGHGAPGDASLLEHTAALVRAAE